MTNRRKENTGNFRSISKSNPGILNRFLGTFRIRRNFKDRLFITLFQDKKALLELYNALNGSHYTNPDMLEITTLNDMVYMGVKNDCSFIIGSYLNLYEHQSTINPNMPIRGFNYFAVIYRAFIEANRIDIYSSTLAKLPTHKYIIFYNGEKSLPDESKLRLSDAFENNDGCLECIATVININLGHNEAIMKSCQPLLQYAQLIDKVREFHTAGYSHAEAVDRAVEYCIDHDILYTFLTKNRNEVFHMFDTDYSEKKFWKMKEYNFEKALVEKNATITEQSTTIAAMKEEIASLKEQIHKHNNH